jgi:subtilisin
MVDQRDHGFLDLMRPKPTGNMLVLFKRKVKTPVATKRLEAASGLKVALSRDFKDAAAMSAGFAKGNALYMETFNIAVLRPPAGSNVANLATTLQAEENVKAVRPEFYMYALDELSDRYEAWVREGLHLLSDGALRVLPSIARDFRAPFVPSQVAAAADVTWGVKAIGADRSPFTGKGVKIAVLDTGFDFNHPDFVGRATATETFVPGQAAQDVKGHGTHCIGTAAGPTAGGGHPRYGVAPEADICVGKVLNDSGSGAESWILAGMEWAIQQGCAVISMSLGRPTQPGEPPDELYEDVGRTALENGALIVAAAGNESARRFGFIAPVGAPANSPSILAVGAVDSSFRVADFSCGGLNAAGGEVNVCGPGVDIFSSFPMPEQYKRLQGTSMATPHVAGVAALWAQSDAALRGQALWDALKRSCRDIGLPLRDGGAGLIQTPGVAAVA